MPKYLLSTHMATEDTPPMAHRATDPEDMARMMKAIGELEADMKEDGAWVFSARMHDPSTATVIRPAADGQLQTTDGPFVEAKEYLAGFYVVEAADLDDALRWGRRVTETIGRPIEVWPFADFAA